MTALAERVLLPEEVTPKGRAGALRQRITLYLSIGVLAVVVLWVLFPGLFTRFDPIVGVPHDKFLPPSGKYWFGTDFLGRDNYTRIVYGTSQTLTGAAIAILIGLIVGALFGLIAASAGRVVEALILRVVDTLLAIPGLLLALSIVATLGPSPSAVAIGIGVGAIAPFARLMRAEVLRVKNSEYVEAAQISGAGYWSTLFKHILPNSSGPVLSLVALEFGAAILNIAALGFLGYGVLPPKPEWGALTAEGRSYLSTAWWLTTFPGFAIVLSVLGFNRVSRYLLARNRI
jgi:peptide/nickel transport system permease protein